jgi:hypothetical protein
MRERLQASNEDLLHQLATLQRLFGDAKIPPELSGYRSHIEGVCERLRRQVLRNLKDLSYDLPDTYEVVLRWTQSVMRELELVNSHYAGPILRSLSDDRLALLILRWLHDEHPKARDWPFGLSDGNFAIYPHLELPSLFFLPWSRQRTLLYLALLFHEFGHLLYALHKPEMDDLVGDFQQVVGDVLTPLTRRRRKAVENQDTFRQIVVLRYYEWCQEFFCDAVGLRIGGPAFAKALTSYFRLQGVGEFYVPRTKQMARRHPVSWLRIKMLVDRCQSHGLSEVGTEIESAWLGTARLLNVREDYEGTWSDEFFMPLRKLLDDMIEEATPRIFTDDEIRPESKDAALTPVALLNLAWHKFEADQAAYRSWERSAISRLLERH